MNYEIEVDDLEESVREEMNGPGNFKQLLDEVFVISGKVEESVISREPKAEADNTKQQPNLIIFLLYIVLKKMTTNALSRFHVKKFQHLG